MARACGVSHKCLLPVYGISMLERVAGALRASHLIHAIAVSIESATAAPASLTAGNPKLTFIPSQNTAPLSAIAAIKNNMAFPILITTGDHPLLTAEMIAYFCAQAERNGADFSAGLARAEVILAAYPQAIRTFFRFGRDRVSGCNLFAICNEKGLRILEKWQYLEAVRKKPWRLAAAFGPVALVQFLLGWLSLDDAFAIVSRRLGVTAKPVLLPFAEAAIDVDKPSDLELAEAILKRRG